MMRVSNYNQADPRWGSNVFATAPDGEQMTIRRWGCMFTSLADALLNYGININPGDLAVRIQLAGGFDAQGYFDNTTIPKMFPDVLNYARENTTNIAGGKLQPETAVNRIKSLLMAGQPVLVWVDNVKQDNEPDHWVCFKDWKNGDFLINNPDGGLEQWFTPRYGDPLKKIYGYLALVGPAVEYPDSASESDKKRGLAAWKASQVAQGKNVKTYAKEILNDLL